MALPMGARAAEVYFDTISTEKAVRAQGAYFGLFGGGAMDLDVKTGGALEGFAQQDEGGWFLGAEIGYQFRTPFPVRPAFELELFYFANEFRAEAPGALATADFYHITLMANFILALDLSDFRDDIGFLASVHPYIGAGLGGAYTNVSNADIEFATTDDVSLSDGSKFSFAYQVFAGLEVALSDYVSVYGEYRRLWISDLAGAEFDDGDQNLWGLGFKVQY